MYINLDNQGKKNPQKTKGNRPLPYKKTKKKKENTKGIMPSYVSDRRIVNSLLTKSLIFSIFFGHYYLPFLVFLIVHSLPSFNVTALFDGSRSP